jgi:hypothetical protein
VTRCPGRGAAGQPCLAACNHASVCLPPYPSATHQAAAGGAGEVEQPQAGQARSAKVSLHARGQRYYMASAAPPGGGACKGRAWRESLASSLLR